MPEIPLFVYGTFKNHETLDSVVKHTIRYKKDHLQNFFHKELRNGYSDVVPREGSSVTGYVVRLTPEELEKTDAWETKYQRRMVRLESGIDAWCYFPKSRDLFNRMR